MYSIIKIINSLDEESKRAFVQWMKQKNRRGDAKNLSLFKYLKEGVTADLDIKLYGKPARNAFHALCKRLQDNLLDFIASKSFSGETSEEIGVLKLIVVGRIFYEQENYKLGYKTLKRAEKIALFIDHYSLLNEIYHTQIQYAHRLPSMNLKAVLEKSNLNMEKFNRDFKLNMAYAEIREKMKKTEFIGVIDTVVEKAFEKYEVSIDTSLSYKSLYQLMSVTSISAKLQRNYYEITPFIQKIYTIVNSRKIIKHKHLFYHIGILHIMAMVHFRNKNFEVSMKFVKKMETEMLEDNRRYFKRFTDDLLMLKVLNYNYSGDYESALRLLEKPSTSLNIDLIQIMCLFQQNKFKDAYAVLKKMNHSDVWYEKKMGWIWVLKKSIIEILLLMELDHLELVLARVNSFKQRFTKRLKDIDETRVLTFINLVLDYYNAPELVTSQKFKDKVEFAFDWKENKKEDIYVMSFYAWLKSKIEDKNLYTTTLHLVSHI